MVRRAVAFDAQRRISDPLFVLVLVLVFGFSLLFNFMTYHGSNSHTMPTLVANLGMIIMIIGVLVIGFGTFGPAIWASRGEMSRPEAQHFRSHGAHLQ
jgi:ABC-type dipeptide/oligopeptide/nickel transport system permease component